MKLNHIALSMFLLATAQAHAQVSVKDAWVRGTVAQQKASGAFMQLTSVKDVRLVAAQSPVAKVVEIHEMVMDKDVMKMRQIPGLDIAAGGVLALKPGGYHIMLIDLKDQLKGGDMVPITLTFEDAKTKARFTQDVSAPVTALGAGNGPAAAGHMGQKH
jgi:copper(I)-binding protein